jgi:exodeoxyribonuclease VII large subunit
MSQFSFLPPAQSERPYSISEINEGIATIIESENSLVWVEGEISNWKPTSGGHCYFRLKDKDSQIPAVVWRTTAAQLTFKPEDGTAVMAIASIRVYQKGGYYQLDVHRMQPLGSGALHAAFLKLKAKLEKEGLFDISFKKPLPDSVSCIGVITSKTGAVIRDIVRVVSSRAPQVDIVLIDVPVQGEKAAPEIARAIAKMNEYAQVDCMIVGRGGGSIEDLWAFNEEIVARAIFDSKIPVISAVGHEIDFTIADFVADLRAPTPSAAAEMAVPDSKENRRYYDSCESRMATGFQRYFNQLSNHYNRAVKSSTMRKPARLLIENIQIFDEYEERCSRSLRALMESRLTQLKNRAFQLNALSPLAVLSRGYAVVSTCDGTSVRDSEQVTVGSNIKIRFEKGTADAVITAADHAKKASAS